MQDLSQRKATILGCGKMGSALLAGWLDHGMNPKNVTILDPFPSEWVKSLEQQGAIVNGPINAQTDFFLLATKPQIMAEALAPLDLAKTQALFVSIAAGTPISFFEEVLGKEARIVRTMPNTPAMIGQGMTALVANSAAGQDGLDQAEALMAVIGKTLLLEREEDLHAVTAISGSGPAYIFAMAEALSAAGAKLNLPPQEALLLAKQTLLGAALLIENSSDDLETLRKNVTSPGGTTQAGLEVLIGDNRLQDLIHDTARAALERSIALSKL